MTQDQAELVCRVLREAGVSFWLAGGWGVDALVGRQTRSHRDLDLLVDAEAEETALAVLGRLGYVVETDWRPVRVEVGAPGAGWVDIHPMVFDALGNGVQAGLDGAVFVYPDGSFTTGRVADLTVGCATVALQLQVHAGYDLRPQDRHDLALLHDLGALHPRTGV